MQGPDIKAAIDTSMLHCPQMKHVVLWGLCDAASASLVYSVFDERVKGLVLANPWIRSEAGIAKTHLKHYYTSRFFEKEFWLKILKLGFDYRESFRSIINQIRTLRVSKRDLLTNKGKERLMFQKKMEIALSEFKGNVLFLISGNDLTAAEFKDMVNSSKLWQKTIKSKKYQVA